MKKRISYIVISSLLIAIMVLLSGKVTYGISVTSDGKFLSFTIDRVNVGVQAAITVTTLGTNTDKTTADPWTAFSSITLSEGDTLVICLTGLVTTLLSIEWNSNGMSVGQTKSGDAVSYLYYLYVVTGGTGNVVVNWQDAGRSSSQAATLYKITGLASSPKDKTNYSSGTGTTASTNSTGTLTQDNEAVIAMSSVNDEIDDAHGSWTSGAGYVSGNEQFGATNGGGDSSNVQCHSVARIVTDGTTQAYQGVDGTHNSTGWSGVIVSFKMASGYDISNTPSSENLGVVEDDTTYYAKGSAPNNPVVDGDCTFAITNNGASAIDIDMHIDDFTGGTSWNIVSGAPSANEVRVTAYYSGQNPASGLVLANTDAEFYDGLAASAHVHWDFKFEAGALADESNQHTSTITFTAVAED